MEHKDKETFHYTYSAKEQEEIRAIRKKYAAPEEVEDKMAQLRRLDASVTKKASTCALVFGMIGALLLGLGMSLVMTELSEVLGPYRAAAMPLGILIGVIGIVLVCIAYPVYTRVAAAQRKKLAPEILRLTEELLK